jgi:hypothetical protein
MSAVARQQLVTLLREQLASIRAAGTYKRERVIASPQGAHITLADGRQVLNFCANNYLGLAAHPRVRMAQAASAAESGAGMASVRFICGTDTAHTRLEAQLAAFHARESAIVFPSCFDANAGIFEALLTAEDAVVSDELNHASIIDGIRLCKAQKLRYRHRDLAGVCVCHAASALSVGAHPSLCADLEAKLQEASSSSRMRMIVTDGVFRSVCCCCRGGRGGGRVRHHPSATRSLITLCMAAAWTAMWHHCQTLSGWRKSTTLCSLWTSATRPASLVRRAGELRAVTRHSDAQL